MERFFDVVQDRGGSAIAAARVTIRDQDGELATIYSDNGVTEAANPLTTNADGEYTFYAPNGRYSRVIEAAGYASETVSDFVLSDASQVYTLTESAELSPLLHAGAWIEVNSTDPVTLTVPATWPLGMVNACVIRRKGSGEVVLAAGEGMTLETTTSLVARGSKSVFAFTAVSAGVAAVYGDLE